MNENKILHVMILSNFLAPFIDFVDENFGRDNHHYVFITSEKYEYGLTPEHKVEFLYTDDDILVKVPNGILNENINLNENLHHINLSNNKVDIKLYNNFLSSKQIYLILAVSLLFSIINFTKIYDYKNSISLLDEKIELEKQKSNLPSSMIQVDSIISKYKNNSV